MPYSPTPYYPPDERTLTQAEIDSNFAKLAREQVNTLRLALGNHLYTTLDSLTEDKNDETFSNR